MLKKVLFINDFKRGGGAEVVFNDTIELLKDKYIISTFFGDENYRKALNVVSYIFSYKNYKNLYKLLREENPDIIHIHNYYHVLSPSILYAIKRFRKNNNSLLVILTAHDYHLICPNTGLHYFEGGKLLNFIHAPKLSNWLFKRLDARSRIYSTIKKIQWIIAYKLLKLNKQFDVIISPSDFLANKFNDLSIKNEIVVIRNPIEYSKHDDKLFIREIGGGDICLKLVFIGRLSNEKGVPLFISNLIKSNFNNYTLDIYGEGEDYHKIDKIIKISKLGHKIVLKGFFQKNQLLDILPTYDVLVLPSICYENAPLSLVEGYMNNLVLLCSNLGGIKEIANICGNSILFDPFSSASLKDAISRIKGKYIFNKEIIDIFSKQLYISKIDSLYNKLA